MASSLLLEQLALKKMCHLRLLSTRSASVIYWWPPVCGSASCQMLTTNYYQTVASTERELQTQSTSNTNEPFAFIRQPNFCLFALLAFNEASAVSACTLAFFAFSIFSKCEIKRGIRTSIWPLPPSHRESSEAPLMRCSQNIEVSDCSERERVVINATECVDLSTEGLVRYPLVLMGHPLVSKYSSPRQMYVRCKCELYMFRKNFTWNGIEKRVNGSSWIVLLAYLDCVFPVSMFTMQT